MEFRKKVGKGSGGGGGGGQDAIPIESQVNWLEIWHYGGKFLRNFPDFSNYFSVFIILSFYVSHSGLIKLTKSFSFY